MVIASALLFYAAETRRKPDQRIEPVERAHDHDHHMDRIVPPTNVRQLVQQHDALTLGRPRLYRRWQNHHRYQHAECDRYR